MLKVAIESPYAGDIIENIKYARAAIRDSILHGEAPIASHLLYTQEGILNDDDHAERQLGIRCGFEWNLQADMVVVYCDRGITAGMEQGIKFAFDHNKKVVYRYLSYYFP